MQNKHWTGRQIFFALVLLACGVAPLSLPAGTLYVNQNNPTPPDPYEGFISWEDAATNIQEAVDEAVSGNTILVRAGRYTMPDDPKVGQGATNVVFIDRPLSIQGVDGAAVTLLDGETTNRVLLVNFSGDEAVLDGFTITNGAAESGGGAYHSGGPQFEYRNCRFVDNHASGDGGAVFAELLQNLPITFKNCVFKENTAAPNRGKGGAIGSLKKNNIKVFDSEFTGNSAGYGGGVSLAQGSHVIENTIFRGNTMPVAYGGGAMMVDKQANVVLRNCLMVGNTSDGSRGGPAIYFHDDAIYMEVHNCTIVDNYGSTGGTANRGAIRFYTASGTTVHFVNSIVYDNDSIDIGTIHDGYTVTFSNNCIGTFNDSADIPADFEASGNIWDAPDFADRAGGNYRLTADSPGVDAGTNVAWTIGAVDLDGRPRISGGKVDMGAYEFSPSGTVILLR